jgi:hypothetical protein
VQLQLEKFDVAETSFHRSYQNWERHYKRRGVSFTDQEILRQVEAIDAYFGTPSWRTNAVGVIGNDGSQP